MPLAAFLVSITTAVISQTVPYSIVFLLIFAFSTYFLVVIPDKQHPPFVLDFKLTSSYFIPPQRNYAVVLRYFT
jgi:hypothetical protein